MKFSYSKKIFLLLFLFVIFLLPQISQAETPKLKTMGEECTTSAECESGDCEKSDIKNEETGLYRRYCDCDEPSISDSVDCSQKWQPALGGKGWECRNAGEEAHFIDYCIDKANDTVKPTVPFGQAGIKNIIFDVEGSSAALSDELKNMMTAPRPRIEIPGLDFTDPNIVKNNTIKEEDGIYMYIPYLGEYISALYKYAVVIASVFAVMIIINHGFNLLMGGNSSEKIQASKKRIIEAVVGLIISVSSYTILYTINPDLVNFKSLRVKYIEQVPLGVEIIDPSSYQQITGVGVLPKGEAVKMAIQMGKQMGITDQCIMIAMLAAESGGNPNSIGHDEDKPSIARSPFLKLGSKYSGQTFKSNNGKDENGKTIINDDAAHKGQGIPFSNSPPDYGLDWRPGITHGFGLGQHTFDGKSYCNGQRGTAIIGTDCYTIADLLKPDLNIKATIALFKSHLERAAKKYNLTGEQQIAAAFRMYNAGPNSIGDVSKISDSAHVQKAMGFYKKCKENPEAATSLAPGGASATAGVNVTGTGVKPDLNIKCNPKYNGRKILVIGDSLTAGAGKWPIYLKANCPELMINNQAVGSMGVDWMWKQNFINASYNDVIIMGGTNSVANGTEFVKNYLKKMYQQGISSNLKVIAITIPPAKGYKGFSEKTLNNITQINNWLTSTKGDGLANIVIDAYHLLGIGGDPLTLIGTPYDNSLDHLHFNPTGGKLLGAEVIKQAYQ